MRIHRRIQLSLSLSLCHTLSHHPSLTHSLTPCAALGNRVSTRPPPASHGRQVMIRHMRAFQHALRQLPRPCLGPT